MLWSAIRWIWRSYSREEVSVPVSAPVPRTAPVVVTHGRQDALRIYDVQQHLWVYIQNLFRDRDGRRLSPQERDLLETAFRGDPRTDQVMSVAHHHILTTNSRDQVLGRIHCLDMLYSGLYGRFHLPYTDFTSAFCWKERLRTMLRSDPTCSIQLFLDKNHFHLLPPGNGRVDQVIQTTYQHHYNDPSSDYSILAIFDTQGLTLEFRRDINHIYLVLQMMSHVFGWELDSPDSSYDAKFEVVSDPVVLLATGMLLEKNVRYPQCSPADLGESICVSLAFTHAFCTSRHHAIAMVVVAAASAIHSGTRISLGRPVYTKEYGTLLHNYNSETYDVDLFDRKTPLSSIQEALAIDRQETNQGERLMLYSSLQNQRYLRPLIGRDYLPSYDVIARHFVYQGPCRPLFQHIHYHTMGIEAWVFEGPDGWIVNLSVNTTRFCVDRLTTTMKTDGWCV